MHRPRSTFLYHADLLARLWRSFWNPRAPSEPSKMNKEVYIIHLAEQRRHHEVSLVHDSNPTSIMPLNPEKRTRSRQEYPWRRIVNINPVNFLVIVFYDGPPETKASTFELLWYCDTTPHRPKFCSLTNVNWNDFNLALQTPREEQITHVGSIFSLFTSAHWWSWEYHGI